MESMDIDSIQEAQPSPIATFTEETSSTSTKAGAYVGEGAAPESPAVDDRMVDSDSSHLNQFQPDDEGFRSNEEETEGNDPRDGGYEDGLAGDEREHGMKRSGTDADKSASGVPKPGQSSLQRAKEQSTRAESDRLYRATLAASMKAITPYIDNMEEFRDEVDAELNFRTTVESKYKGKHAASAKCEIERQFAYGIVKLLDSSQKFEVLAEIDLLTTEILDKNRLARERRAEKAALTAKFLVGSGEGSDSDIPISFDVELREAQLAADGMGDLQAVVSTAISEGQVPPPTGKEHQQASRARVEKAIARAYQDVAQLYIENFDIFDQKVNAETKRGLDRYRAKQNYHNIRKRVEGELFRELIEGLEIERRTVAKAEVEARVRKILEEEKIAEHATEPASGPFDAGTGTLMNEKAKQIPVVKVTTPLVGDTGHFNKQVESQIMLEGYGSPEDDATSRSRIESEIANAIIDDLPLTGKAEAHAKIERQTQENPKALEIKRATKSYLEERKKFRAAKAAELSGGALDESTTTTVSPQNAVKEDEIVEDAKGDEAIPALKRAETTTSTGRKRKRPTAKATKPTTQEKTISKPAKRNSKSPAKPLVTLPSLTMRDEMDDGWEISGPVDNDGDGEIDFEGEDAGQLEIARLRNELEELKKVIGLLGITGPV